jgi:putative ATP-dependent endonuclease of OLD family
MIELESFSVSGLKSLSADVEIPVRRPSIITGANDGGKSSSLLAAAFLLGEWSPGPEHFTAIGAPQDDTPPLRATEIVVEGGFTLSGEDLQQFGPGDRMRLRRRASESEAGTYEVYTSLPVDPRLRSLGDLKLPKLRALAQELGVEPIGKKSARGSWLDPLQKLASEGDWDDSWAAAPRELVLRLPSFVIFSSTDEPDPEAQIRNALQTAYRELLEDDDLVGPVREVEAAAQGRLSDRADDLCSHVQDRCPELSRIEVKPEVTFSHGFRNVDVLASRPGGVGIPLNESGAGRKRRINLAIWEWTGELLLSRTTDDRSVVIAYDEPDTHLDYGHQRELITLIRDQCSKTGVRMLVATHSLNLIDRVAIEDVVHLRLEDEVTVAERLMGSQHEDIQRYLVGVSEAMGLRNSVLLHERCFVGVEGPTEVQVLPVLFRLVTGMSLQSAGIAIISGNGNDGALKVIRFLKDNGRRLAFVLVDSDSTSTKLFQPERLASAGIDADDVHYVGAKELEDLFSDEQWAEVANRDWPREDGRSWISADFSALRIGSKFSQALENVVRPASLTAPKSKPGYLAALVQGLADESEVPVELAEILRQLAVFAAAG